MVVNSTSAACAAKSRPLGENPADITARPRPLHRDRVGLQSFQIEEFAVPVELRPALQQPRPDLEPLQPVVVAALLVDRHAVQVELLLVPAADDVEAGAAMRHMIDRGDRLGAERRRHQRHMHGGEDRDALRQRAKRRAMRQRLERAAVDIGLALDSRAISPPAG